MSKITTDINLAAKKTVKNTNITIVKGGTMALKSVAIITKKMATSIALTFPLKEMTLMAATDPCSKITVTVRWSEGLRRDPRKNPGAISTSCMTTETRKIVGAKRQKIGMQRRKGRYFFCMA